MEEENAWNGSPAQLHHEFVEMFALPFVLIQFYFRSFRTAHHKTFFISESSNKMKFHLRNAFFKTETSFFCFSCSHKALLECDFRFFIGNFAISTLRLNYSHSTLSNVCGKPFSTTVNSLHKLPRHGGGTINRFSVLNIAWVDWFFFSSSTQNACSLPPAIFSVGFEFFQMHSKSDRTKAASPSNFARVHTIVMLMQISISCFILLYQAAIYLPGMAFVARKFDEPWSC